MLGKTEFVKALGTADRMEAARLARQVSVRFDNECDTALRTIAESSAEPSKPMDEKTPHPTNSDITKSVLSRLPGIIRMATESVIAEQAKNMNWKHIVDFQRQALAAHIRGEMPNSIAMHPLEARAALKAIDAAARGEPLDLLTDSQEPSKILSAPTGACVEPPGLLRQKQMEIALAEYGHGRSHRRKMLAQRQAERVLQFPCSREQAIAAITESCRSGLASGKKASSVWTEASAVIALLKCVPGWHEFSVPKVGALRQLRGAGAARRDARAPMPVSVLHHVLRSLPQHLPRDGEYWHAALLVCALYGLRPGELLRAGVESLQKQSSVFGNEQLIFRVGMHGAKNASSVRDLPVPDELSPLFHLALSRMPCNSETAKTRVDRLNVLVRTAQTADAAHTLYSVRHLFADVARACGYPDAVIGPIMGHTSSTKMTGSYGGNGTLGNERELLRAVQLKLFPNGLAPFLPSRLHALVSGS